MKRFSAGDLVAFRPSGVSYEARVAIGLVVSDPDEPGGSTVDFLELVQALEPYRWRRAVVILGLEWEKIA